MNPRDKFAITILEAAELIGMSEGWIKAEIRSGRLKPRKFGRSTRIMMDDFKVFLKIVVNVADLGQAPPAESWIWPTEKTEGYRQ